MRKCKCDMTSNENQSLNYLLWYEADDFQVLALQYGFLDVGSVKNHQLVDDKSFYSRSAAILTKIQDKTFRENAGHKIPGSQDSLCYSANLFRRPKTSVTLSCVLSRIYYLRRW